MKKVVTILLSCAALIPAQAQWLPSEAVHGAFLGGMIGGFAGGNRCHGFSGESAFIGASIGLIAGSIIGESRRNNYYETSGYVYPAAPVMNVSFGYGYQSYGSSVYVSYTPNRYCAPGTYYRPTRPNYVVSGTVSGAAPAVPKPAITSTPCATSTYTWTARPQIADASRVPDAPTF